MQEFYFLFCMLSSMLPIMKLLRTVFFFPPTNMAYSLTDEYLFKIFLDEPGSNRPGTTGDEPLITDLFKRVI